MRATDEVQAVLLEEVIHHFRAEGKGNSTVVRSPLSFSGVLVRILNSSVEVRVWQKRDGQATYRPQQVAHKSFLWNITRPTHFTNLVHVI